MAFDSTRTAFPSWHTYQADRQPGDSSTTVMPGGDHDDDYDGGRGSSGELSAGGAAGGWEPRGGTDARRCLPTHLLASDHRRRGETVYSTRRGMPADSAGSNGGGDDVASLGSHVDDARQELTASDLDTLSRLQGVACAGYIAAAAAAAGGIQPPQVHAVCDALANDPLRWGGQRRAVGTSSSSSREAGAPPGGGAVAVTVRRAPRHWVPTVNALLAACTAAAAAESTAAGTTATSNSIQHRQQLAAAAVHGVHLALACYSSVCASIEEVAEVRAKLQALRAVAAPGAAAAFGNVSRRLDLLDRYV